MSGALPLIPRGGQSVMAGRVESADSLDDFPTQLWGTRALWTVGPAALRGALEMATVWEPCCGRLTMVRPLREFSPLIVHASDVFDYGIGATVADFREAPVPANGVDWVISNPPFNLALAMYLRAWEIARVGVAFLLRLQWLEGIARYEQIYRPGRITWVCPFVERLPMHKGRLDPQGGTMTAYAWYVGLKADPRPEPLIHHIPPCRAQLTRPDDWTGWVGMADGAAPLLGGA